MPTTLNDFLSSRSPGQMVSLLELTTHDIQRKDFGAVNLLGIFNAIGPTLVALDLLSEPGKPSVAILRRVLNPFAQSRLLVSRALDRLIEFWCE